MMTIKQILEKDILEIAYMLKQHSKWSIKYQQLCQDYKLGKVGEDIFEVIYNYVKEKNNE